MFRKGLPGTVKMKHDLHYVDEIFHEDEESVGKYLPIDSVEPNPEQPRQAIGDLSELANSIREKGVLEPLIVRPYREGYQIIAGERRWRACKQLGLERVPCIVREADEREVLELALIENLQRKDLTPFEEAEGLQALADRFEYTHAQIAQVIGKSRTSVTESLSLNQIPQEIRELCRQADISSKSLLLQVVRQPDEEEMKKLVEKIGAGNLSREDVRQEKGRDNSRPTPFVHRYKGKNFSLIIKFNKSNVSHKEIASAIQEAGDKLG